MAVSASFAIALDAAADLIAGSATFQSATGTVDKADARSRVYFDENPRADADSIYPFAIISLHPSSHYSAIRQGCVYVSLHSVAVVLVELVALANTAADDGPYLDFVDFASAVMDEMSGEFNGENDKYGFTTITIEQPPIRTDHSNRNQQDIYYLAASFGREDPS